MKRNKYHHYVYFDNDELKDLSLKEKKSLMDKFFITYRKYTILLQHIEASEISEEKQIKAKDYIAFIDKILDSISLESKDFLINMYLVNNNNSLWWMDQFNRSTFFKIRRVAFDEFLVYVL